MMQTSGRKSATGSSRLPVLYDGWPLACAPGSPAALHIQELLQSLPAQVKPWLALPGDPGQNFGGLEIEVLIDRVPATLAGRLRWEQASLPRLARRAGARLLHTTGQFAPLVSPTPCLVSPVEIASSGPTGGSFFSRLRTSLNLAGRANIQAVLWPDDLPDPPFIEPVHRLPPLVHRAFYQTQTVQADFPDDFILCPGPLEEEEMVLLADVWGWASAGLGEAWSLVVSNLSDLAARRFKEICQAAGGEGPVVIVDLQSPERRAAAVQQAGVLLVGGQITPWGDSFLQALACAKPLVAGETDWADARVGSAGYLAHRQDARTLGAAVITLVVEEPVSEQLSQAAGRRAAGWRCDSFPERLWEVYQHAAGAGYPRREMTI